MVCLCMRVRISACVYVVRHDERRDRIQFEMLRKSYVSVYSTGLAKKSIVITWNGSNLTLISVFWNERFAVFSMFRRTRRSPQSLSSILPSSRDLPTCSFLFFPLFSFSFFSNFFLCLIRSC